MSNKYVILDNTYTTEGTGATYSPWNWSQFLNELSGGGYNGQIVSDIFNLSGTRTLSADLEITLSAENSITLAS